MLSIIMTAQVSEDYFFNEVSRYCEYVKSAKQMDENNKILMPGEIEHKTRAQRRADGIELSQCTIDMIQETCESLDVSSGFNS